MSGEAGLEVAMVPVFSLLWDAFIVSLIVAMRRGRRHAKEIQTLYHPGLPVPGVIVETTKGDEDYLPTIAYKFSLDGREIEDRMMVNRSAFRNARVGKPVTVLHDSEPRRSVVYEYGPWRVPDAVRRR